MSLLSRKMDFTPEPKWKVLHYIYLYPYTLHILNTEIEKNNHYIHLQIHRSLINQTNLSQKSDDGDVIIYKFKLHYNANVLVSVLVL